MEVSEKLSNINNNLKVCLVSMEKLYFISSIQKILQFRSKLNQKIPHKGDKASLDRCGQQHRYHSRVDQEYPKTRIFETWKKSSKTQKTQKVQKYAKISDTPFDQRSLIHREAWFPGGPRIPKKPNCLKNRKNPPKCKNSKTSKNIPK